MIMSDTRFDELYRRLGPVLYARAIRVLKDQRLSEELTRDVVKELATLGDLPDAELLKRGREKLEAECATRGKTLDSMIPGLD